ncbi:MAG TPA: rhodanese-like domain-containing protein [Myxococcota bacterium]|nr:rhodanese-like domain-containing protein [Myxococcota bacterium]
MRHERIGWRRNAGRAVGALALALAACGEPAGDSAMAGGVTTMTASELAEQISRGDAPLILDVRSDEEYDAGHIPGALHIPHDQLADRLGEIGAGKGDPIVVHCHSGRRAQTAEEILTQAGYSDVRDLEGHIVGWQDGGYPIETP